MIACKSSQKSRQKSGQGPAEKPSVLELPPGHDMGGKFAAL